MRLTAERKDKTRSSKSDKKTFEKAKATLHSGAVRVREKIYS